MTEAGQVAGSGHKGGWGGVMNSKDDKASLGKLRALLLSSLDFSEAFGQPKYGAAVFRFSQEIRSIKREFMSSFEDEDCPIFLSARRREGDSIVYGGSSS
jgi:hypothetical protein